MKEVNAKKITIMTNDGTVFNGMINIGSARRVSDFIKRSDSKFIIIFDATRDSSNARDVYFLNLEHVVWMRPEDLHPPTREEEQAAIAVDREMKLF